MGIRYLTQAQGPTYTVVDDLQIGYQALVTGSLIDEVSGTAPGVDAFISVDLAYSSVNTVAGGLFAVVGYVERVFPEIAVAPSTVHLDIQASGYRPANADVPVPAGTTDFPIAYPAIPLHPVPVRLQGRVVKASSRVPIAGAAITSSDDKVLLLRSPLYFDHATGVDVNAVAFTNAGPTRKLAAIATGRATSVFLDSTAGLAGGQILSFGSSPNVEYGVVKAVGPNPAQVTLQHPLNGTYALNAAVQEMTAGAPSSTAKLSRDRASSDGVLVLNAAMPASAVQLDDGPRTEYHLLDAVTDSSGYYHVDGATGVVSLKLKASASGFADANTTWFLVYNDPVNVVDFRL